MGKLELAKQLATYAHDGQTDKAGKPYILHPLAVAAKVSTEDEKTVALLHDILEDTFVTESTVRNLFGDTIADAVVSITRQSEESYDSFIVRVARNPIARVVKIADLAHNMDLSRLGTVTGKDIERFRKYEKASKFLLNCIKTNSP